MKSLVLTSLILAAGFAAEAKDQYSKLKVTERNVVDIGIKTEAKDIVQAAEYADGGQIEEFIALQLKDAQSILSKEKAALIEATCESGAKENDEGYIDSCGSVEISDPMQISFYRSGWADAGAEYLVLMGFRDWGTGMDLTMSRAVIISESVNARTNDDGNYKGLVVKTYKVEKARPFEGFASE